LTSARRGIGKRNGELLAAMSAAGFTILLTVDQNLRYEQNLATHGVAVIVMVAKSNTIEDLTPLIAQVEAALAVILPGEVLEVS
jgi:hypothetical protein